MKDVDFKRLFELSGDAMMVLGRETFLYCNPATLKIFACPSIEVFHSKHPSDFSPLLQPCGTPSLELSLQHIREALRLGHKRFEWVHQRLSGEQFYADVLLNRGIWQGEQIIQAVVRDISTYKSLQDSLRREKEQSEKAARAKSEFLAVMSHEIRTPIHGILGAQELLKETSLDPEQQQLNRLSIDSTRQLLRLVNDVLDFSKIDAGKLVAEAISFSVNESLIGIRDLFKVEARRKSLDFVLDNDKEMDDVWLVGDWYRLQQVLNNLISNAIKFTKAGGRITLSSRLKINHARQNCRWLLAVTDTGIGMNQEQLQSVFEEFTQADSSISRSYGGTGLGLSISKALVELLGGTIEVHSRPGEGSRFEIQLTLKQAPADTISKTPSPADLTRHYERSVLVAEDNPTNQLIIRKKLERLGLRTIIVNNGLEALDQYEASLNQHGQSSFAAILMDVQMPIMNGIDASRELRLRDCQLPIFALSADVQNDRQQQCLDAGMQAFIGKPFEDPSLVSLFDRYFVNAV